MGTITRTFANNITTSGVFKPTAFNNASFDNVTAVPEGVIEGGNMVLLSTQTASGDASISFTTGIDSTYKEYMFIFNNIHGQNNADPQFNLSTDGGSTYAVTKTTTFFIAYHSENDSESELVYRTADDLAQSTSYQPFNFDLSNASDSGYSGYLHLFNPSDTTYVKHFILVINGMKDSFGSANCFVAGYGNTTSAINAIDFKFQNGNIDDGTIQMFGIL